MRYLSILLERFLAFFGGFMMRLALSGEAKIKRIKFDQKTINSFERFHLHQHVPHSITRAIYQAKVVESCKLLPFPVLLFGNKKKYSILWDHFYLEESLKLNLEIRYEVFGGTEADAVIFFLRKLSEFPKFTKTQRAIFIAESGLVPEKSGLQQTPGRRETLLRMTNALQIGFKIADQACYIKQYYPDLFHKLKCEQRKVGEIFSLIRRVRAGKTSPLEQDPHIEEASSSLEHGDAPLIEKEVDGTSIPGSAFNQISRNETVFAEPECYSDKISLSSPMRRNAGRVVIDKDTTVYDASGKTVDNELFKQTIQEIDGLIRKNKDLISSLQFSSVGKALRAYLPMLKQLDAALRAHLPAKLCDHCAAFQEPQTNCNNCHGKGYTNEIDIIAE